MRLYSKLFVGLPTVSFKICSRVVYLHMYDRQAEEWEADRNESPREPRPEVQAHTCKQTPTESLTQARFFHPYSSCTQTQLPLSIGSLSFLRCSTELQRNLFWASFSLSVTIPIITLCLTAYTSADLGQCWPWASILLLGWKENIIGSFTAGSLYLIIQYVAYSKTG